MATPYLSFFTLRRRSSVDRSCGGRFFAPQSTFCRWISVPHRPPPPTPLRSVVQGRERYCCHPHRRSGARGGHLYLLRGGCLYLVAGGSLYLVALHRCCRRSFALVCALLPDIRPAAESAASRISTKKGQCSSRTPSPPHLSCDWRPLPLSHPPLHRQCSFFYPQSDQNAHFDCAELFLQLGSDLSQARENKEKVFLHNNAVASVCTEPLPSMALK